MEVECLGTGESLDPALGNTSFLVHSESKLLIDCGCAVPQTLFRSEYGGDFLDALYLTHFHGDHTFGIPALLAWLLAEGRTKPFVVIGQPGTAERVTRIVSTAYNTLLERLTYPLDFIETTEPRRLRELDLAFAPTSHTVPNYAIRVSVGEESLAVSGDGAPTEESLRLYAGCRVLFHEAYSLDKVIPGHTTALEVVSMAAKLDALEVLGLVHIDRKERRQRGTEFLELQGRIKAKLVLPETRDCYALSRPSVISRRT